MPDLHEPTTSTAPHPNGNLEELQKLLLEAERGRLDRLEDDLNRLDYHLKNKVIDATAVAKVLPDAIRQRSNTKQDQDLEESLESTFVSTFRRTVNNSQDLIAEAISPVMMPAIRKAIASAMQDIAQSMNRTLDHRGLVWRWEAWKTGRPLWEIVLAHTVKYRVERVFLFYREDGLHLGDVHHPDVPAFEPGKEDLVSSMFSAIQTAVLKFTQDEFQVSEHASMKEIRTDDGMTVLIEQGHKAVLAAVVRGVPPSSLRTTLKNTLDSIHVKLSEALQNFRGDKQPFEAARPYLESCLLQEKSDAPTEAGSTHRRLSPVLMGMLMVLLILLVWGITGGVTSYLEHQRWADFQDKVKGKTGIHITSIDTVDEKNGKSIVYGLRDPLSDDPQKIAQEVGLSHEAIDFRLEPYRSLAPELIERRAHNDQRRLNKLVQEIEAHQVDFELGSAALAAASESDLRKLRQALRESDTLAQQLGSRIRIEIQGHTTEEGSVGLNRRLALARAQRILSALTVERFPATDFLSVDESVGPSVATEIQGSKPQRARRVSFHVTVDDFGSAGPRL